LVSQNINVARAVGATQKLGHEFGGRTYKSNLGNRLPARKKVLKKEEE